MAEATKVIRAGQTPRQLNAALLRKAILTAGLATVDAAGHTMQGVSSINAQRERTENRNKSALMQNSIRGATLEANAQDRTRAESQQYAAGEYTPPTDNQRPMPEWLGEGGEATPEALKAGADSAIERQKTNMAAQGQAVGGYDSPDGIEAQHQASTSQARDMRTGDGIMKMGGMMNSLPRTRR